MKYGPDFEKDNTGGPDRRGNYEDRVTPETEIRWIETNPEHGGKIGCHKCSAWIYSDQKYLEHERVFFHEDCFNKYEHYYGLDKPID